MSKKPVHAINFRALFFGVMQLVLVWVGIVCMVYGSTRIKSRGVDDAGVALVFAAIVSWTVVVVAIYRDVRAKMR